MSTQYAESKVYRFGNRYLATNSPQAEINDVKTIDTLLAETGLSLSELAERCQLTPQRMEAIVSGRWLPSPSERQRLAAFLGLPLEEIGWGHSMTPRNIRYQQFGLKENF